MWKGEEAGYAAIHDYVRARKTKPEFCERCGVKPPIDLANISQTYKRELSDWEYLCRKCHMDGDGRNDKLRASTESRKIPSKTCEVCGLEFHRTSGMQTAKYCSRGCYSKAMTKYPDKVCPICGESFRRKVNMSTAKYCSNKCKGLGRREG